jgi:NAD(P)-dependent dehydrogenase (short-subunit alcohol dehydrogenase family)
LGRIKIFKNRFGLEGKVALVTGAAQGLGFELAQNLSQEGLHVVIADVNMDKGEEAAEKIRNDNGQADYLYVDLCSQKSISDMAQRVGDSYTKVDLLVNNAVIYSRLPMEELSFDHWEKSMKVSLSGSFFCARELAPLMEAAGGGAIVNISSIASDFISDQSADYHVGKAGICQLSRYLAWVMGPKNIRVNTVSPGFIVKKDNIEKYNKDEKWKSRWEWCHALRRSGRSEDISNLILFLASEFSSFITGQTMVVDGGLTLRGQGNLLKEYSKITE